MTVTKPIPDSLHELRATRQSLLARAMDPNNLRMFYSTACLVCLKASSDIRRCSKCKIAPYCSKEHQQLDWKPSHKPFCQVVRNCKLTFAERSFEDFRNFQVALRIAWETDLNRELYVHEEMMTLYPRVCVVCFSTENLFGCEKCLNVSYCSKEHADEHSAAHQKHCDDLRLGLVTDQYMRTRDITYVEFEPTDNEPLRSSRDIQKHLATSVRSVIYDYLTEEEAEEGLHVAKTLCVVLGLNILYALKVTDTVKPDLVIHVVGSDLNELLTDWLLATNIIRHWMPEITGLVKYYLVGPAILDQNVREQNAKEDGIVVKYFGRRYHEIIELLERPDIVFAFNCGLHEFVGLPDDPWRSSVPTLLRYENVPLVITSYTEFELINDKEILMGLKYDLDVVVDISENPFASIKPLRDWTSQTEPVFYMCKYVFIAKRMRKDSATMEAS